MSNKPATYCSQCHEWHVEHACPKAPPGTVKPRRGPAPAKPTAAPVVAPPAEKPTLVVNGDLTITPKAKKAVKKKPAAKKPAAKKRR